MKRAPNRVFAAAVALIVALVVASSAFGAGVEMRGSPINPKNILRLMNAERAAADLPPLRIDPQLTEAALDRMHDMEDGSWWAHESPEGASPFRRLVAHGYDFAYAGENLAAGFETAELLVASWMESPGHRANVLGVQFSDCGIAIIDGSTKGPASGQSVVVMFGRRKNGPAVRQQSAQADAH